jgi:transglutaminase-like putative cysteine protease
MSLRPKTGWTSLVLIACLMLTVAWSIALAQPGPAVGVLSFVVVGGVLAGTVMGGLGWLPAGMAHLISMGAGTLWTAVLIGQRLEAFPSAPAADIAPLGLLQRTDLVRQWYLAYVASHPYPARALETLPLAPSDANDLMYFFFLVTMAMLVWLLAYICTWFVVRYLSWWGAVLPSGFALVFNLTNSPRHESQVWYLGFFLFCAFLLAAQVFAALQVDQWRERRVGFSLDLGYELLRDAVLLAVICLALGALLPEDMGLNPLQQTLRDLARNPRRAVSQQIRSWFPSLVGAGRGEGNSFGNTMDLGGSISLGTAPVFEVTLNDADRLPGYFRQAVYDRYDGRRWQRSGDDRRDLPIDAPWGTPAGLTVALTQTIQTLMPQTLQLYAAPQPSRFSLETRAETADGDVLAIESRKALPMGSRYTVVSNLTAADPASLRVAERGEEDPSAFLERYTQLPAQLPERVRALAREWVQDAGASNRFDMASALEARLREHISYSEQIDQPPAGRDRVDWVLFDGRQGYCDYYASSFVVMARSLGIPARLATGYALGERRADGRYLMTARNAHAWPEVYFGGYGWVEFEPTGGGGHPLIARPEEPGRLAGDAESQEEPRPAREVERPDEDPDQAAGQAPAVPPDGAEAASGAGTAIPWRLLGGLMLLACATWAATWALWLRPLRGLSPAAGAFARLDRLTEWLGLGRRPADTPYEFEARLERGFPQGRSAFSTIVDQFVRERFGRRAEGDPSTLASAWRRARGALLREVGPITWRRLRGRN